MTYRTRFVPALALGGHGFVLVDAAVEVGSLLDGPERPSWFRCDRCYWSGPSWAIVERLYPVPCRGVYRAIGP